MHFALPTRGNHRSSPFLTNSVSRSYIPARRPLYAIIVFVIMVFVLLRSLSGGERPADAPHTVMVLVLNRTSHSTDYINKIVENRQEYAKAHGYGLFKKEASDYAGGKTPSGWARIPAIRHAMSTYKYSEYFWYLDQDAIIMNPSLSIESHIISPLGNLIRRDVPIVPPDSVIRTYRHVPPQRIQFIISQDKTGLQPGSMIIKSGAWANYFLDAWYDPMFRFYSFAKAEQNALEHIVQWHPTILTKLALIPQKTFNSFSSLSENSADTYEDGDFVINLYGCSKPGRNCEKEFNRFWDKRKTL
ncbi:galactosyl transferase GMA12/MNN10 family-domain-containing protein [Trichophaea hybrida]|nr:galactosyl transferase GMA12/MNN10 family-domain-containing protein [Trichophaea hybrida]